MRRGMPGSSDGAGGRPRYGRAYADQLKQNLAKEMERRKSENDARMRKLRDQFRTQNKEIEQASSGVREKLERAKMENAAHIEEMQEQREVEVEEINRNTERIKEQVDGVGEGLKEQLQSEYDAVTQAAQDAADKPLGDDAFEEEVEEPVEDLPYSLDLYLSATGGQNKTRNGQKQSLSCPRSRRSLSAFGRGGGGGGRAGSQPF